MRLLIKQKVFALTDSYNVYDERGERRYTVEAALLALRHKLTIRDARGREVGEVREHLISFLPVFDVSVQGRRLGTVQRKLSLLHPKYEVDYLGWRCEGDVMGWNYEVREGRRVVCTIHKELLHWGDTYVLDIRDPQDELAALMLVIAIDAANCTAQQNSHNS